MTDPAALVRFDWRVLRSELAQTFARWSDRAWLVFGLVVVLVASLSVRTTVLPFDASLATAALSAMSGVAVANGLRARLTLLAEEGAPVVFALDPVSRQRHLGLAIATVFVLLLLLVGVARPSTIGVAAVAFALGTVAGQLVPLSPITLGAPVLPRAARTRRALAGSGWAGVAVALGLLLAGWIVAPDLHRCVVATLAAGLALMPADAELVRFEAVAGLSTGRSLDRRLRAAGVLLTLVPLGAWVTSPATAAALALTGAGVFALAANRLLLTRTRSKRGADLMLSGGLVLVALLAVTAPPLALAAVVVALVRLVQASERARWRLAG